MADTIKFNITEAAEDYANKAGYTNSTVNADVREAFVIGAEWAFDMIEKHCKGSYITSLETKGEPQNDN